MFETSTLSWVIFSIVVLVLLAVDLFAHRNNQTQSIKHALLWSLGWIALAFAFCGWIYTTRGPESSLNFLAGYLVEKALSVDNLFVFLLIFKAFHIPPRFRHKVLFWGIVGAFVMRAVFILFGIALITYFDWIFYVFGAFLIYTAYKLAFEPIEEVHPENNPLILWFEKWMPIVKSCDSGKFLLKINNKTFATPLFLSLLAVETSDLIFALDSIPAILGITTDPFIVLTSNIFAILGLRSLYFALEGMMDLFHYLHYGLAFILAFIGIKMLIIQWVHIPIVLSLFVIIAMIAISIGASLIFPKEEKVNKK